jgi:hypothetical protein
MSQPNPRPVSDAARPAPQDNEYDRIGQPMIPPRNQIPLSEETGKDRWNRSAELTRLEYEMRALAVAATLRCNSPVPTADEFQMWAKDLRRGRMSVAGSVVRFLRLIEQREMGADGRRIALEVTALLERYIDILLPPDAPKAEPVNTVDVDITSETRKARIARVVHYGRTNRSA